MTTDYLPQKDVFDDHLGNGTAQFHDSARINPFQTLHKNKAVQRRPLPTTLLM